MIIKCNKNDFYLIYWVGYKTTIIITTTTFIYIYIYRERENNKISIIKQYLLFMTNIEN